MVEGKKLISKLQGIDIVFNLFKSSLRRLGKFSHQILLSTNFEFDLFEIFNILAKEPFLGWHDSPTSPYQWMSFEEVFIH